MENYGIIIRHLRGLAALSVRECALKIGRSTGWLSEIENQSGTARLSESEFNRIVDALEGRQRRTEFKTWVANQRNEARTIRTFEGAVLKFVRKRKGLTLRQASSRIGMSPSRLSKLETGLRPVTLGIRKKIMLAYSCSPSSFKNFLGSSHRIKVVPVIFKIKIALAQFDQHGLEDILNYLEARLKSLEPQAQK